MHDVSGKMVLAINAGSSGIKFAAYHLGRPLIRMHAGLIDWGAHGRKRLEIDGIPIDPGMAELSVDHANANEVLVDWFARCIPDGQLAAISHRLVYGHRNFRVPTEVDRSLLTALRNDAAGAVDHLPQQIELIEKLQRCFPGALHLACFDSAFHSTMPDVASTLPIPRQLSAIGIQRFGFHGISCDYLLHALSCSAGAQAWT